MTRPAPSGVAARFAAASIAAVLAAACSSPPVASPDVPDDAGEPMAAPVVEVDDSVFRPERVTIEAGTEVRWVWIGRIAHNVVGDGIDSGLQVEGEFAWTFDEPGTYPYVCTLHAGMVGEVVVVPAG